MRRTSGFTLIELLAVIGLISVLAGVFSFAVLQIGSGSMEGAERIAGSQFAAARNQALLRGREVRVLVNNNPEDAVGYRREIGIVTNVAEPGETPQWAAFSQGEVLPGDHFFVPEVALGNGSREPETMRLVFPSTEPAAEGQGDLYYYFEYNERGMAGDPGAQFAIEPGRMEPRGEGFEVVSAGGTGSERKDSWGGFLILRIGGVLYFPDGESIREGGEE